MVQSPGYCPVKWELRSDVTWLVKCHSACAETRPMGQVTSSEKAIAIAVNVITNCQIWFLETADQKFCKKSYFLKNN